MKTAREYARYATKQRLSTLTAEDFAFAEKIQATDALLRKWHAGYAEEHRQDTYCSESMRHW